MSMLSGITRGKIQTPDLIVVYGPDGVGKSTFAAQAPKTIFLGSEKGTANLDVARLPTPKNFEDCQAAVMELISEKHDFETLAVDSLDWIEPLVWDKVCRDAGCAQIEQAYGGYGKGYTAALKLWQGFIGMLSDLREKRKMNIILIAHSQVKTFQDPQQNAAYDRYQLKLNDKASSLFREFVDCVFFANFEVYTKETQNKKTLAFGEGARKMFTERRPAFDAKNRFGLPTEMPFSWEDFTREKRAGSPQKPETLMRQINELLSQVTDADLKTKVEKSVKDADGNPEKLMVYLNRLRTLMGQ